MKRIVFIAVLLFSIGGATEANAQILKKATEVAKKATERQVEKRTEKTVDKVFEKVEEAVTGTGENNTQTQGNQQAGQAAVVDETIQQGQSLEMTYAKSDFVAGDEIFFEDLLDNEKLGEFPSMWDLISGYAEVAAINGKNVIISGESSGEIAPLMKDMKSYLPEQYTIEMDLWLTKNTNAPESNQFYELHFYPESGSEVAMLAIRNFNSAQQMVWNYTSTSGQKSDGSGKFALDYDGWHHLSISFNQRAFKAYLDGVRIANIPNMTQAARFTIKMPNINGHIRENAIITNVRIAKGAVPLYDRMMSDGKFITYGITFDVGKSTIKPESMGEINRIVELMTQNPDLKFSVEGHTDSTGNAASNQTLSEARNAAIVSKLVEMGISADRLTASGKGQNNPIADNGTDEGRAKNRRVEFIKI